MQSNLDELEQALSYQFVNRPLLVRAVTHSSSANEVQSPGSEAGEAHSDNERLEFLGDAILGWLVSEWVFEQFRISTKASFPSSRITLSAQLICSMSRIGSSWGDFCNSAAAKKPPAGAGSSACW